MTCWVVSEVTLPVLYEVGIDDALLNTKSAVTEESSAKGKWVSCLIVRDRYSWHLEISPKNMLKMVRFVPKIFFKQSPVRRTSLRWTMAVFAARYEVILSLVSRNCTSRPLGRHEHQKQNRPSAKKHLHFWSDLLNFSHKLKLKRKLDMLEFRDLGHFKINFLFRLYFSFSSSVNVPFFFGGIWVLVSLVEGKPLDGIIIETTGLADPAPVAQTFFADEFVRLAQLADDFSLEGLLQAKESPCLDMKKNMMENSTFFHLK